MSAIEIIKDKLKKYPEVKYKIKGSRITIEPIDETGFEVSLEENEQEFTVSFEGWHEHFKSMDEALDCVAFGLSERCRLRIFIRGSSPYKWQVEYLEQDAWKFESETGLFFFPYWKKKKEIICKNKIIKLS